MLIELLDSGEILVSADKTLERTASDEIYIPLKQFAEENDVSYNLVRLWKRRGHIETISIFGQVFVKKDTQILKRRYSKRASN